jgi:xylulokinase
MGAGSRVWMQIAADILGHSIEPLEGHPGSCLGAAYVAGVAVGGCTGWDEIARYVHPAGVVEADPARADRYARR